MDATRVEKPTIKEGFRLGDWLVQPGLGRLSRNGSAIHLEPKHMDLLVCLAQHPRQIRTKEQIFDAVWPD